MPQPSSRREFLAGTAAAVLASGLRAAPPPAKGASCPIPRPLLTAADDFYDVSRGNPKPHTLVGEALTQARLTPETWRLEIITDPFTDALVKEPASLKKQLLLSDGTALDFPTLVKLGKQHGVRYLKAMQCLNIAEPLGQGLWEGVPLREVLKLCGGMHNARRIYFWGFHNNDPKQLFQSSLSFTQAMETAPGELPPFVAYRLNGQPISLERGGPVRMVIPWAHGFKSIKWLQRISVTNDFRANDTYANANNDPESHLKTAAYIDTTADKFPSGQPVFLSGRVISGLSGVQGVEYSLRRVAPEDQSAPTWKPCDLEPQPQDWSAIFPAGVSSKEVLGFDPRTGRPLTWPLRYGMVSWSANMGALQPGRYEVHARAVDLNGFAQPEPRPLPKSGKNAVETHRFEVS